MPLSCFTKKSTHQSPSHSHSTLNHHHHHHHQNMSPSSRLLTKLKLIKSKPRRTDSIISQPQPQPLPISNPIENQADYIPILALDIPSGSLLPTINQTTNDQNHPNSNLEQNRSIGEDVDLDVDLNNYSNFNFDQDRPNSPWVDLGERSNELDKASQLLLSGTGLSEIGKRRCQNVHFGPNQLNEIFRLFNKIIFERGLDTLGIFRPWRFSESGFQIGRLQLLLIDYLLPIPPTTNNYHNNNNSNVTKNNENLNTNNRSVKVEEVEDELVFTLVHDLIHVLKWAIRHLSYLPTRFAINSNWYNDFSTLEREKSYPSNAYTTLLLPLLNQPSQVLLNSVLELVAAVSAHADSNAMPAGHLCKILGFWILGHGTDRYISYEQLYFDWDRAGRAFEHIFLSYLRSQGNKLPKRLKELISVYPAQNDNFSKNDAIFSPRFSTKSIKVLKVQIETHGLSSNNNLNREQVPIGSEEPKSAGSINVVGSVKRGTSLRSRVRSRRSASVSSSTPAIVSPLPRNQSINRRPLEILKAAGTAEIATDLISLNIWESLLESSKSSERNQLLLVNETKELMDVKEFLGLIDDETLRVIELTQLSSASTSTTDNPKQSTQITRPRSFSLETPSLTASSSPPPPLLARPSHLSTLYEDNKSFKPKPAETRSLIAHSIATSSPAAPTSSWADFVNSGFSTSNPTALPNISNPEPIPRVSSSTTRSTPINTRPPITKKTRTQRKPPVANSIRSIKSNTEDPPPPPLPIHKSLIKSVNIISVDESFPDVWLDTLAEPMILSQWPKFLISPLPHNHKKPLNEPTHLLLDENFVDELEINSDEQQRNIVGDGSYDRTELGFIHLNHSNSIDQHHQPDQNTSSLPTSPSQLLQSQSQHKLRSVLSTIGKNSKKRISSLFHNSSSNHDEPANKKKKKEIKGKLGSASSAVSMLYT
ncbi:hypothetical protein CROQUDRAFT_413178 [Cronartium quercuum f. sp. fusiforme G11]|uniref:Meiotically up-regulated protein Msb1/Mug8 domain-containing protein n=1 Tax=Cronartium quercuum f. sp. fusiforme G11 TaxID=708437 RepID=A0A9P6N9T3_9BASI|nr:hypothetical protein CROQUDRAFT_413178 [Cronartium quercuum f. sp. fusiforme G11]